LLRGGAVIQNVALLENKEIPVYGRSKPVKNQNVILSNVAAKLKFRAIPNYILGGKVESYAGRSA
jgi:hypothetical protein